MAKKKSGGSSNNGRDSASCRLGFKIFGGAIAKPGAIILRQRGSTFNPGNGCFFGKDYTIHAKSTGIVCFANKNGKKIIYIQ